MLQVVVGLAIFASLAGFAGLVLLLPPSDTTRKFAQYALVFVVVAILVIAALMILGPGIGKPFSTINKSLNGV